MAGQRKISADDIIAMRLVPAGGANIMDHADAVAIRAAATRWPEFFTVKKPTGGRLRGVSDAEPYFHVRLTKAGRRLLSRPRAD